MEVSVEKTLQVWDVGYDVNRPVTYPYSGKDGGPTVHPGVGVLPNADCDPKKLIGYKWVEIIFKDGDVFRARIVAVTPGCAWNLNSGEQGVNIFYDKVERLSQPSRERTRGPGYIRYEH